MTEPVVVVGSGAAAAHFSLTALELGVPVTMVDVGATGPEQTLPDTPYSEWILTEEGQRNRYGNDLYGVRLPGDTTEYYGLPKSKQYVTTNSESLGYRLKGFRPLISNAMGGLGEAWTGGCFPFDDDELADFPFGFDELEPHYETVAQRIGITGRRDDLTAVMPVHQHLQEPLDLDPHAELLMRRYQRLSRRDSSVLMGYGRSAVLSKPIDGRQACNHLGRCMWGCPRRSFYTPSLTLDACRKFNHFNYIGGQRVRKFIAEGSIVKSITLEGGSELDVGTLVLACGTIESSALFLRSIARDSTVRLTGLMDNRQMLIPFLTPKLIGAKSLTDHYQYHQLALSIQLKLRYHAQLTTIKGAASHVIAQQFPGSFAFARQLLPILRPGLGLISLGCPDRRQQQNYLSLHGDNVQISYRQDAAGKEEAMVLSKCRQFMKRLGSWAARPNYRPAGASVHYAGTLPYSPRQQTLATCSSGRSYDFNNLVLADAVTFPSLPAKGLTLTIMANASRTAKALFG